MIWPISPCGAVRMASLMVRYHACRVQGHRQELDEKLATSDIQLFGRPSGLPGSRRQNGHAEDAAGLELGGESDADTDASDEEDAEDDEAGTERGSSCSEQPLTSWTQRLDLCKSSCRLATAL